MRTAVVILALTTSAAALGDDLREEAKQHFTEAEKQFQLGHFADAAKEYEAGYNLYPRPGFLWDIAQSYRKLGENEKALHFYKQYVLNAKPGTKTAVNVPEAQEQIRVLEPLVAAQQKAKSSPPDSVVGSDAEKETPPAEPSTRVAVPPAVASPNAPPATATPSAQPERWYRSALGWSLAGLVVASGIVAGVLLARAASFDTEASKAISLQQQIDAQNSASTYRTAGWSLIGLGGAALVGSVAVFIYRDVKFRSTGASRSVGVALTPTSVAIGGAW